MVFVGLVVVASFAMNLVSVSSAKADTCTGYETSGSCRPELAESIASCLPGTMTVNGNYENGTAAGQTQCDAMIGGSMQLINYCIGTETTGPCRPERINSYAAASAAAAAQAADTAAGWPDTCVAQKNLFSIDPSTGLNYYYSTACTPITSSATITNNVVVPPPAVSANLTINGATTGSFMVGDNWTFTMTSNQPNATIDMCAIHPDGAKDCTPTGQLNFSASTDQNGGWTAAGTFPSATLGSWTEWACFGSVTNCDAGSAPTSSQVSFTVSAPTPAPVSPVVKLAPIASTTVTVGQSAAFTAVATDTDTSATVSYGLAGAPTGSTIGASTGVFSWNTTGVATGTYSFVVTAHGGTGGSATSSATITVAAAPACTLSASDFESDLSNGKIVVSGVATNVASSTASFVLTNKTQCTAPVSLSSYKVFVAPQNPGWLATQQLFDATSSLAVAPNSSQTFTVKTASCMTQVDAWYGTAPATLLDSNPYGYPNVPFVLTGLFVNAGNLCGVTPTTPSSDLSVTKTVSNATPITGTNVDYTITASASGNATSTGVT
ncbi:MAG: putative Ig domain-containing protein, partial [Minisyncoccia bacterium]